MKRFTLFVFVLFFGLIQFCDAQYYYNRAFSMDGNNANYVSVPGPAGTLNITGSFTLECWLKPNNIAGAQMIIKKGDDVGNLTGYALLMDAGRVRIRTNGSTRLIGTTAIPVGVWSHFAGTYNSSTNTFTAYVNGVASGTATVGGASPLSNAGDSVLFGRGYNSPYNGQIDEIRIWNVEKTASEIQATMRMPLGESGATGPYTGLVGAWRCNSITAGSGVEEISGHNAFLRGAATYVNLSNQPNSHLAFNTGLMCTGGATGTCVEIPHSTLVNPTTAVTLECWLYTANTSVQVIFGKGSSGYPYRFLKSSSNTFRVLLNGTFIGSGNYGGIIPTNKWVHLSFTYNSSNGAYAYYMNGVETQSGTQSVGPLVVNSGVPVQIGGGTSQVTLNGMVDEVRICSYAKTAEQVLKGMFTSIDASNEPNPSGTNVTYNFEGTLADYTDGAPRGTFVGDLSAIRFTRVYNNAAEFPVTLDRHDAGSFANGYRVRYADLTFGSSPTTITDSIFMPEGLTISDVNVFVGVTHTYANDINVSLRNPANSTTRILYPGAGADLGMHMITIFDDQADSTIGGTLRAPWSPRVKPTNTLALFNGQNSLGWWKLILTDIFPGADNGTLVGWGIQFNNQTITGIEQGGITEVPKRFYLYQNFPNPFNPTTTIKYDLAKDVNVKIVIYDVLGREVQVLFDGFRKAGSYSVLWNAINLASGTYLYRIEAGDFVDVKKMVVVK